MTDHVARNREAWAGFAADYVEAGRRRWAAAEPCWGVFDVPESEARVLPDALDGATAVELGCGTGYVSSWLARRGARPVGVDLTREQLASASRFQAEFGIRFPLVRADAERAPLRDASFDLAISEYGASIWCDPYRWIPEAARLLRPGGELIFLVHSVLVLLCMPERDADGPATDRLLRPQRGMHRLEWPEDPGVNFGIAHGAWIDLLRANGFEVIGLTELYAPEGATTRYAWVDDAWATRWPVEEVWKARKRT